MVCCVVGNLLDADQLLSNLLNWIDFYYQSIQVQIWKAINRHIKCTEIIEHLGSKALTGILVQKIYMKQYERTIRIRIKTSFS